MVKGIIIGVLIYSLVLTIVTLYKDNSSYFMVETLDVIVAGPVAWILMMVFSLIRPILKKCYDARKTKERTVKNEKYIKKVVAKIIKKYTKYMEKRNYKRDYFNFNIRNGEFNVNDIEGWGRLEVKSPLNEKINKKFSDLMYHQKEQTIKELKKYFKLLTEEEMRKDDCDEYWISVNKHKEIYILS